MRLPPPRQALILIRCSHTLLRFSQAPTICCYHCTWSYQITVKLLLFISNAFINTMGITQPSPKAANRAAWFIFMMLSAVLATVVTIAVLALRWASHH
jgi:hypothetical protein